MTLLPATLADLGFIRSLTGRADYAPFLTDEDETGLATYLTNPTTRLVIWHHPAGPAGFALFADLDEPSGAIELRRLALDSVGQGQSQPFLHALADFAFHDLGAKRLWLDASSENPRAQKAYLRAGFTLEGRLRRHWYRPALGRVVDLLIYGMLRDEWLALAPLTAKA